MLQAYLLDRNEEDLEQLSTMLTQAGDIVIVGQSTQPLEAITQVLSLQPDALFLELELYDMHGILVVEHIKRMLPHTQIVIVTINPHHALSAFDQQVADYVLKPLKQERLNKTMSHLYEKLGRGPRLDWEGESREIR